MVVTRPILRRNTSWQWTNNTKNIIFVTKGGSLWNWRNDNWSLSCSPFLVPPPGRISELYHPHDLEKRGGSSILDPNGLFSSADKKNSTLLLIWWSIKSTSFLSYIIIPQQDKQEGCLCLTFQACSVHHILFHKFLQIFFQSSIKLILWVVFVGGFFALQKLTGRLGNIFSTETKPCLWRESLHNFCTVTKL